MTKKYLGLTVHIQEVQFNAVQQSSPHYLTSCRPVASFGWAPVATSSSQQPVKSLIIIIIME